MSGYDTKSASRTTKKRCGKCGKVGWFRPRERRCKRTALRGFGKFAGLYYCLGELMTVDPPTGVGRTVRAAVRAARRATERRPQAVAARQLRATRTAITRTRTAIRKATGRLRRLEAKAERLAARAVMTDEEVAAEAIQRAMRRSG